MGLFDLAKKRQLENSNDLLEQEAINRLRTDPLYAQEMMNQLKLSDERKQTGIAQTQGTRARVPAATEAGITVDKLTTATAREGIANAPGSGFADATNYLAQIAVNKETAASAPSLGKQTRAEAVSGKMEAQGKQRLARDKEKTQKALYDAQQKEAERTSKLTPLETEHEAFLIENKNILAQRDQLSQRLGLGKEQLDFRTFMTQIRQQGQVDANKIKQAWAIFERAKEVEEVSTLAQKFGAPIRAAKKFYLEARTEGWLQTKDADKRMKLLTELDKLENPQAYKKYSAVDPASI